MRSKARQPAGTYLAGEFRWDRRFRSRWVAQRSPAVRTIHIHYANQPMALRAAWAQLVTTARAEVESALHGIATLWADALQRLPQDEVKQDAQSIGNQNGHERPKHRAHRTALRVTVYIADEKQVSASPNARQ